METDFLNVCLSVNDILLYTIVLKASVTEMRCIYYCGAVGGKLFWFLEIQMKNKSIS